MPKADNKYTRLLSNTVLFAVSTFSSKVLSFVLTRLYTSVLTEASYGIVDLVVAASNLLIPLVSLGISNAVIRFGLEKGVSKQGVFTSGLLSIGAGFGVLLCFLPLMGKVSVLQGHVLLMYVYVLVSCLRTLCCQFVRAKLYTRLYAIDGILSTLYTVGFNVLFLVVWNLGTAGYLLSIICADALSIIGLFVVAKLHKYIRFKGFSRTLWMQMLRYSLPLVPALMFWWVTNASDRFFITYMCGEAQNGLYAAAYKVPSIVTIISTLFTEAWQLSAVTDGQGRGRERFFSQVFAAVLAISFCVGGGLIYACRWIMRLLVAPDYYTAWQYIPFLVLATVFSCLVAFMNSVYMVEKKSGRSLATMLVGALSNLVLNALLIPQYGPNGAAFATFLSYALVFVIRAVDTRRLIAVDYTPVKMLFNTGLLLAMAFVMVNDVAYWQLWCALLLLAIVFVNIAALWRGAKQLLAVRKTRKSESAKADGPG